MACLDITIDERGRVSDPEIVGSTEDQFGRDCVAAVREWRFQPFVVDGHAIRVRTRLNFDYRPR
jgi:TonB family protein